MLRRRRGEHQENGRHETSANQQPSTSVLKRDQRKLRRKFRLSEVCKEFVEGSWFVVRGPCLAARLRLSRSARHELRTTDYGSVTYRQSAINTFVSPSAFAFRFEAKTRCFPSGENIGNPSNVSLNVTRSRPVPSTLTR